MSKMKVTITCRVTINDIEMDNEADCRFFFLLEKRKGIWGVVFYTLLFDKDKMIPVNPTVGGFEIPEGEVEKYPRYVSDFSRCLLLSFRFLRKRSSSCVTHGP